MATRLDITLVQSNDEQVNLAFTEDDNDDLPQNITGAVINAYLKAAKTAADSTGTTWSTSTGEIVVVSGVGGTARLNIPKAHLASANRYWWRVDLILGGLTKTACFGFADVVDV